MYIYIYKHEAQYFLNEERQSFNYVRSRMWTEVVINKLTLNPVLF
jgi:hypothetical protein